MFGNSSASSRPDCMVSTEGRLISAVFMAAQMFLVLPFYVLVLYLGHQRWRQQRSFATTSHSDIITYHMAAVELLYAFGSPAYFFGMYTGQYEVMLVGYYGCCVILPGQMLFHILTCLERYLAVVHPVTYMGLRQSGGVRIRNISIACVWLLSCSWSCLSVLYFPHIVYRPLLCSLVLSLIIVSYCSVRVLCVLIRPGPGEVGGKKERVDQSKQRAFQTVRAIMGVLWLWFAGYLVSIALERSQLLNHSVGCVVLTLSVWFSLPSNLVLPLLFLHRAGKLLN